MSLVEVDPRFRVTIPKEVREKLRVEQGQKLYVVSSGSQLIMKPVPTEPARRLDKVLGEFDFDEKTRRNAEKWLIRHTREQR